MLPVLCREEIIRAVRIRKLLEQAESEDGQADGSDAPPAGLAYRRKALAMARAYSRGPAIIYDGKYLLGDE